MKNLTILQQQHNEKVNLTYQNGACLSAISLTQLADDVCDNNFLSREISKWYYRCGLVKSEKIKKIEKLEKNFYNFLVVNNRLQQLFDTSLYCGISLLLCIISFIYELCNRRSKEQMETDSQENIPLRNSRDSCVYSGVIEPTAPSVVEIDNMNAETAVSTAIKTTQELESDEKNSVETIGEPYYYDMTDPAAVDRYTKRIWSEEKALFDKKQSDWEKGDRRGPLFLY